MLLESTGQLTINPRRAYELATEAHRQALDQGTSHDIAKTLHSTGIALTFLGDYETALAKLDEAQHLFASLAETEPLARVLNSIGMVHYRAGDTRKALRSYNDGIALLDAEQTDLLGKLRCNIALIYNGIGAYEDALKILLEFLPLYEGRDDVQTCTILDNLGGIYAELGDREQSMRMLLRSLECSRTNGHLYGQAMALGNLGALANESGAYQEALTYLNEALEICQRIEDRDGTTRALHNLGVCHDLQGNYRQALRYLRRSAKEARAIGNLRSSGFTYACIGGILRKTGQAEQGISMLQKAAAIARQVEDIHLEYNIYNELSNAYEACGNLAEALACYRRYSDMREEVEGTETRRKIAELQIRFDLERAEQEKELYRLRNEQLEKDLRIKTGELTAMALRLVQRSEMMDSVKQDIAEVLVAQNGSAHPTLHTVLHTIQGDTRADGEWQTFQQQFHRVHPDYIRTLSLRFPSLSPTELKICALLKIDLNSKEVARLLHVSVRDIENHRYRIRKKLNLCSSDNLATFLAGI